MPTTLRRIRQGLPRVRGEPWPPPGTIEVDDRPSFLEETAGGHDETALTTATRAMALAPARDAGRPNAARTADVASAPNVARPADAVRPTPPVAVGAGSSATLAAPVRKDRRVALRRGLPRTPGGEPWPPAGIGVLSVGVDGFDLTTNPAPPEPGRPEPVITAPAPPSTAPATAAMMTEVRVPRRRGLPRTPGGEPWPSAGFGVRTVPLVEDEPVLQPGPADQPAAALAVPADRPDPSAAAATSTATAAPSAPVAARVRSPEPGARRLDARAVLPAAVARVRQFPALAVAVAVVVLGAAAMLVQWLVGTGAVQAFTARYPGTYPLPPAADPGFPAWVRWSHFLNLFFILLIIRTGLQVHYEKKAPAYWTPRWSRFGGKISISSWLHQTLDVLWLVNGIAFVTLLFATNHWMRIVPTSWAVFPNALSTALQYASLRWPTDSGWVSFNSLQQLAYFTVIFVAAPLAAVTGVRMSGLWPLGAQRLSRRYPVEVARAIHFPTMWFFAAFVVAHVTMVFATGARRNLNHMFGGSEAMGWAGFWIFAAGLVVVALAWELARPVILAPLANLVGRVSQR